MTALVWFGWSVALTADGRLSAVIVYGLAILLLWWAVFLFRRRRQILREDAADLTCVDLDEGHVSTVSRDDVDSTGAVSLRPLLEKAVRTGEVVPLPDDYPREVVLQAAQEGDALVFQILSPFDTPLASVTAVRSEAVSGLVWPTLVIQSAAPTLPDRPPVPWCAMTLPIVALIWWAVRATQRQSQERHDAQPTTSGAGRPATDRQLDYIESLLDSAEMPLNDAT